MRRKRRSSESRRIRRSSRIRTSKCGANAIFGDSPPSSIGPPRGTERALRLQRPTCYDSRRNIAWTPSTASQRATARLQPLCDTPAVAALGPEGRRYVLIQTCLRFMNETVLLETDVVARLAADLANRPHRVALSAPVGQVALTIAVDEAYHAFAAREFIGQIREVSGIEPVDPQTTCGLALALEATLRVTPETLRDDVRVAALCIAENSITAEILGMTEETPADNPFHIVPAEHLV